MPEAEQPQDQTKEHGPQPRAPPPAWLDAALVQAALRHAGERSAAVQAITVRHANAPGENYVSEMFRVTARLRSGGERPLIVKCLPAGEEFPRLVQEAKVFVAEALMFTEVVPALHAVLQSSAGPGSFPLPPFTARCLHWDVRPSHFLVLDDLAAEGFRCGDRHRGLGAAEAGAALRSLARWHAASLPLLRDSRRRQELIDPVPNFFRGAAVKFFRTAVEQAMKGVVTEVAGWSGEPWQRYAAALDGLSVTVFDMFVDAGESKGGFDAMLHGDFWMNNMLFRYASDGAVEDVRFVDLQLSHVGPVAADLLYFLHSSLSEETAARPGAVEELVEEYRGALAAALAQLGLAELAPTADRLRAEMRAAGGAALVGALCVLPLTRARCDKVFSLEESMSAKEDGGAHDTARFFASPEYGRTLRRLLPEFERLGWLTPGAGTPRPRA